MAQSKRETPGNLGRAFWLGCALLALSGLVGYPPLDGETAGTFAVLAHVGLGILLPGAGLIAWLWRRCRARKDRHGDPDTALPRAPAGSPSKRLVGMAALLLILALSSGVTMGTFAASGRAADRPDALSAVHGVAGAGLGLLGILALWGWRGAPARRASSLAPRLITLVLVILLLASPWVAAWRAPESGPSYDPESYYRTLTATNARQAANPFFPAGARLVTASEEARCSAGQCHARERAEWLRSRHAAASRSAYYLAALREFARTSPDAGGRWCQGCHGSVDSPYGVGCISCHAIRAVPNVVGNGQCLRVVPARPPLVGSGTPWLAALGGWVTRLRPRPHRLAYRWAGPLGRSEACAPCHRMGLSVAQNRYRFLRAQDEYGSWQASFISGESAHGFAPPWPPRSCQSCHMTRAGGRSSHDCESLPAAPGTGIHLDIIGARTVKRRSPVAAGGGRADTTRAERAGRDRVRHLLISLVVANHGVGHEFPAGTTDLRDTWLELTATMAAGRRIFHSGSLAPDGSLDPHAHRYGLLALDRSGRVIRRGDLHRMVTPLYRRSIAPGEADVARYRIPIAGIVADSLRLKARLMSRRVNPQFHRSVYPGGEVALPPPRVVARCEAVLRVGAGPQVWSDSSRPAAKRYYDLGVGLLVQSDFFAAAAAMRRVQELDPQGVDGHLGLGRVFLQEGDLLAARRQFELASEPARRTRDPRPTSFLGTVYRKMGEYDRALGLLEPLARRFPRDRVLLFDIGMSHYRSGRNSEAAEAFRRILDVDPDDVAGHYNLMLCLQRMNQLPEARREETIYRYLKEDESVRQILGPFLRERPGADREAQGIHEHGG